MPRTSLHKSLKQVLHGNEGASGAEPGLTRSDVILVSKDTCINRENPNRVISKQPNIVVGYDFEGTYDRLISSGFTQGTWTLPPILTPALGTDSAGSRSSYLSRALLEFNLRPSGVTTSGAVHSAILSLTISSHRNLQNVDGITLDLHTFYCASSFTGGSNTGGATLGDESLWDGNATWYEWKYTGACEFDTGLGEGLSGAADPDTASTNGGSVHQNFGGLVGTDIGVAPPGNDLALSVGFTGNIWTMQGLGATGGMGQRYQTSSGPTTVANSGSFLDFSQGVSAGGHYDAALMDQAGIQPNFELYPQIHLTNKDITSNTRLDIDITKAVRMAILHSQSILRIMINLESDYKYNRGFEGVHKKDRAWVGFHSRETSSEPLLVITNSLVAGGKRPNFAPHLLVNYDA